MDLTTAAWRKSSRSSAAGGNCVEVADNLPTGVAIRDSKNPTGGILTLPRRGWTAFVTRIKRGDYDR